MAVLGDWRHQYGEEMQRACMRPLYCDYNATTPVLPRVAEAMKPWLSERFGNPGSAHSWGLSAKKALERSRVQVAQLLHCAPDEVIFTSGATESNNLVLFTLPRLSRKALITTAIEHPSVLEPARILHGMGLSVTVVTPDPTGQVNPDTVLQACEPQTGLISVMLANNETGVLQPVEEIAARARERGILIHTDAAQAVGKIPVNVRNLGVDFLTLAGHKLYAPKGIGALYLRAGSPFAPLFHGGGQEGGRRPGTENVALCVALGEACVVACEDLEREGARQAALVDVLLAGLRAAGVDFHCLSELAPRLPNTVMVCFPGLRAGDILSGLVGEEVGASAGAACHSGVETTSHVLRAMGVPEAYARGAVRFSIGRQYTGSDHDELLSRLLRVLDSLRPAQKGL